MFYDAAAGPGKKKNPVEKAAESIGKLKGVLAARPNGHVDDMDVIFATIEIKYTGEITDKRTIGRYFKEKYDDIMSEMMKATDFGDYEREIYEGKIDIIKDTEKDDSITGKRKVFMTFKKIEKK